ncbi:MAG: AAA family ATPase [Armatimonadota bacterium]|nr:AAA family ATPase [Armatimonadota bacterium]
MALSEVVGHDQPIEVLTHAIATDRIAKAYLFVGPPNVGKTLVAKEFAKAVNCESPVEREGGRLEGCDSCHNCVRIDQENHPDLLVLRPSVRVQVRERDEDVEAAAAEGEEEEAAPAEVQVRTGVQDVYIELPDAVIYIDQIRRLIRHGAAQRSAARRKFYIICSAETMNDPAENALLKTLEEPPPHTTLILTTANLPELRETTVSRCQVVRFQPLSHGELREVLAESFPDAGPQRIAAVAAMAGGRYGRAQRLMDAPGLVELRGDLLELAAATANADLAECLHLGERVMALPEQWWEAAQAAEESVGVRSETERTLRGRALEELGAGSPDRINRIQMSEMLDLLQTWYRDLTLLRRAPDSELVINADRLAQLRELAPLYSPAGLIWASDVIEDVRRDLSVHNANFRLACQTLMVKLIAARRR